jgi:ABC-2 type transport system permease protein
MTELAGIRRLIRLALRRDRIQLPVWIVALSLLNYATAESTIDLYPDESDRVLFAVTSARSVVVLAFNGLITGTSPGSLVANQSLLVMAVGAALMSTFAVVRHTRQNEETGRAEMIGAGVVGRYAPLSAAIAVVVGANVVLSLVNAAIFMAIGLPVAGSLATGLAIGAVGIAFAGVASLAVQVPESARTANGMAAAAIGVAFLLRAVGDLTGTVTGNGTNVHSGWLSWLSPIGWGQQIRPYDDNQWWVLGLLLIFTSGLIAAAFVLTRHRDVGAGLVPTRTGPAKAVPSLLSPLGLAWRLQRGSLYGWAVAIGVVAVAYGAVGNELDEFVGSSEEVADLIAELGGGDTLADSYFAVVFGFTGIAIAAYIVQALLRLRSEETGPLESILATAVSRPRWLASHLGVAVLGAVALLFVMGVGTGLTYGLVIGDLGAAPSLVGAALIQLPAALVTAGLVVVAFGLFPKWAVALSWAVLGVFLVFVMIGPLLSPPQWILDLSPFSHTPGLPAADVTFAPIAGLLIVAALLFAVGITAFRRRDVVP